MIIKVNLENISISSRIDFLDENNGLLYWSIYDFSYKRRMRLFDSNDNELGYVTLKIDSLNNTEAVYDKQDNKLAEYSEFNIDGDIKSYEFKIDGIIYKKEDDNLIIKTEENKIYATILYTLISIDKNEKE